MQSHFRELRRRLQPEDVAWIGHRGDSDEGAIQAAVHLMFAYDTFIFQTFVAAIAVSRPARGQGGAVADEAMALVLRDSADRAREVGLDHLVVTGKIHVENLGSQRMAQRHGWEPVSVAIGGLQLWRLARVLDN